MERNIRFSVILGYVFAFVSKFCACSECNSLKNLILKPLEMFIIIINHICTVSYVKF